MTDQPSRQTLDEIPARVLTFLIGVNKYPTARAALSQKGYAQADHDHAWGLLATLGSYPTAPGASTASKEVRDAVVELDAWDEPNFAVIRAALQHKHPALVDVVFKDLGPKEGPEAVMSVSKLLDRLDALEQDTSADAQEALQTITARGYTQAERQRLRALVALTTAFTAATPVSDAARQQVLRDLYAWHGDWSTTAKAVIKRRALLIALGLASRRKATKAAPAAAPVKPSGGAEGSTP